MTREDLLAVLGLAVLWAVPILLVGASGDFPLSDDWAYARATRTFVESGRFERDAWVWIPLFTHTAIGSAFVSLFGFSFEVLRWSGLTLGLVGVLGTFALCRTLGASPLVGGLGAASVATNPLWVNLSFSFMTDVPFAALCVSSLAILALGVRGRGRAPALALGAVLAVAAAGSRQIGLALLPAVALPLLAARLRDRRSWAVALVAVLLGLLFVSLVPRLFSEGDSRTLFTLRHLLERFEGPHAAYFLVRNSVSSLVYLGVFLVPAVLLSLPADRRLARRMGAGCAALACLGTLALGLSGFWRPPGIDVIRDFYMGPISLAGRETLPRAPAALWWGVTALGLTSGCLALARLTYDLWSDRRRLGASAERLVPLLFAALYLGLLLVVWPFFDRYLVPLLAPLVALLVSAPRARPARGAAVLAGVVLAAFALAGTHDTMEHHRARWALLDGLLARGVASQRIDGGTEFGGWLHYHPDHRRFHQRIGRYFVVDDEYLVSLGEAPDGYEAVDQRVYRRLLPPRRERVTLYRRASGASGAAPSPPS